MINFIDLIKRLLRPKITPTHPVHQLWTGKEYIALNVKHITSAAEFEVERVVEHLHAGRPAHFVLPEDLDRCLYNLLQSGALEYVRACAWYVVPASLMKQLHPDPRPLSGLFPGVGVGGKLPRVAGRLSVAQLGSGRDTTASAAA
jgi:hypothetical protein